MKSPWSYKKTARKTWTGRTLHEAYLFGEYMGLRTRRTDAEVDKARRLYGNAKVGIVRWETYQPELENPKS